MDLPIQHNAAQHRFECRLQGELALCEYHLQGRRVVFTHTEVPEVLAGQGVAAALVRAGLDWVRAQGFSVQPQCSYVAAYMRRHPDTQDLLGGA